MVRLIPKPLTTYPCCPPQTRKPLLSPALYFAAAKRFRPSSSIASVSAMLLRLSWGLGFRVQGLGIRV